MDTFYFNGGERREMDDCAMLENEWEAEAQAMQEWKADAWGERIQDWFEMMSSPAATSSAEDDLLTQMRRIRIRMNIKRV